MLLNARKLFLILTPPLTILITTLAILYYVHHLHQQHQQQQARLELKQQQRAANAASAHVAPRAQAAGSRHKSERGPAPSQRQDAPARPNTHPSSLGAQPSEMSSAPVAPAGPVAAPLEEGPGAGGAAGGGQQQRAAKRRHWRQEPAQPDDTLSPAPDGGAGRQWARAPAQPEHASSQTGGEPRAAPAPLTRHQQQAEQQVSHKQQSARHETIDIVLDRDNFILHNRCSTNRLYVRMSTRSRRVQIGTRQQKLSTMGGQRPQEPARQRADSAKMKLLSMVMTVESVHEPAQHLAAASQEEDNEQEQDERQPNEVRLRANLTELYVCFGDGGQLEARVSSSRMRLSTSS